jgi:hypothetical protein
MTDDDVWHYAGPGTTLGAIQRGLGRAALLLRRERDARDAVLRCVIRDHRWDWQVDERAVYLARLVQELKIPVMSLVALVYEHPEGNDDNTFDNALAVLAALGRGGDAEAIDGLRRYVGDGPHWALALEHIASDWPREHWDDLLRVAQGRLADGSNDVCWNGRPWQDWATTDDRIAAEIDSHPIPRPERPMKQTPTAELLSAVGTGDLAGQKATLRELNRRGPQPALLSMLDGLPLDDLRYPVGRAVDLLGDQALPVARRWAATPGHPMRWTGHRALAAHGDDTDVPALLACWDWLDSRPHDRCGYDLLATGLARIGGDAARTAVPRLHHLWCTPHSYERAAYLRALLVLDPDQVHHRLTEGLWDCEAEVRRLAAEQVSLEPAVEERLAMLRDDQMEAEEVRAAARARLA